MTGWGRIEIMASIAAVAAVMSPPSAANRAYARQADTALLESSSGAVSVSASVDRARVTAVQSVTLTVDVRAEGIEVAGLTPRAAAGETLGDFTVAWVRREPASVDGGTVVHRWVIGLEPFLPGTSRIPAIGVTLAGSDEPVASASSEPIAVEVESVLDEAPAFEPARLRPPLDPMPEAPPHGRGWIWIAAGALAATGAGVVGVVMSRPTPERRVRWALAPIRRRAAAIAGSSGGDAGARAVELLGVIRDAATTLMGDRARALTSGEMIGELAVRVPGIPASDLERLGRLMAWHDGVVYAGLDAPPPEIPNVVAAVEAIESAALAAVRGKSGSEPGGPPA